MLKASTYLKVTYELLGDQPFLAAEIKRSVSKDYQFYVKGMKRITPWKINTGYVNDDLVRNLITVVSYCRIMRIPRILNKLHHESKTSHQNSTAAFHAGREGRRRRFNRTQYRRLSDKGGW